MQRETPIDHRIDNELICLLLLCQKSGCPLPFAAGPIRGSGLCTSAVGPVGELDSAVTMATTPRDLPVMPDGLQLLLLQLVLVIGVASF